MKRWRAWRTWLLVDLATAALIGLAGGCGSGDDLPREPVSGRVTFDGEPLSDAWIEFRPKDTAGVTAMGAMIEDGRYSVSRSEGLVPGEYRVAINKAGPPDGGPADPKGGMAAVVPKGKVTKAAKLKKAAINPFGFAKQLIPAQYNKKSELKAKVEAGKSNDFDFALSSK